jgi:hypothetical protein
MSKVIKVEKEVPDVSYELIEGQVKYLQGKVLTVIEAVITDPGQARATKSLIKRDFNDTLTLMFEVFMNLGLVEEGAIPDYEDEPSKRGAVEE